MSYHEQLVHCLGLVVVCAPAVLMLLLGLSSLVDRPLAERAIGRSVLATVSVGLIASLAMLGVMLSLGSRHVAIDLGAWAAIPQYHFELKFVFDRLSVPFVILTFLLCGTIGAFANRYMHRERGFNRFFVLYALFMLGMVTTSLAGTIETLFAGWELVGLSSALLVAFFHERPAPSRNGLRVWCVYRVSDAGLLIASVVLHHMTGDGDFDRLFVSSGHWPDGVASLDQRQALLVGLLFLVAAAGKSALVPFSGWLPRAMEGPTPSSAVFYGALSVHLGAFLLLRVSPILDATPALGAIVVAWGLGTSAFASFTGRVQTDIKCALSFASLSQVGIIVAEIGLASLLIDWTGSPFVGHLMRYVALLHILGHGSLRTLQFLRAPTLLYDYNAMENAIGAHLPHSSGWLGALLPAATRAWLFRLALERGYLDALMNDFLVAPLLRVLTWCDRAERRWTDFLSGGASRESDQVGTPGSLEDLP